MNECFQETISILSLLSALVYKNSDAKTNALKCEMANIVHKIFRWWKLPIDRSMLHGFIELLINFTEEFPEGKTRTLRIVFGIRSCF